MWSDCANLQSDLVLVTLMSSTSWKGAEKWSINQPPSSLAYFQNIPEVQALVILSPHLNQQILSSEAHDIYVTLPPLWENHGLEPMIHINSGCMWLRTHVRRIGEESRPQWTKHH